MRPLLVIAALIFGTACAGASAGTATDTSVTTVSTLYGRPPTTYLPAGSRGLEYVPHIERYADCLERFPQNICALER